MFCDICHDNDIFFTCKECLIKFIVNKKHKLHLLTQKQIQLTNRVKYENYRIIFKKNSIQILKKLLESDKKLLDSEMSTVEKYKCSIEKLKNKMNRNFIQDVDTVHFDESLFADYIQNIYIEIYKEIKFLISNSILPQPIILCNNDKIDTNFKLLLLKLWLQLLILYLDAYTIPLLNDEESIKINIDIIADKLYTQKHSYNYFITLQNIINHLTSS